MSQKIAQRDAFGKALVDLAQNDSRIITLDGDLATSTKTDMFAQVFPERFLQMGIAEQNMFGVAAGLATLGFIPFATTFACFTANRALDQIRIAIAQPKLNVKMVGAYSGILTGKTGKTHQTIEDLAVFRAMPYVTTIAPVDGLEVRLAMEAIVEYEGPVYLRLTRDPCPVVMPEDYKFKIGQAVLLREGGDVTLMGTGQKTIDCLEAADQLAGEGVEATVLHVPTLKPLDEKAIIEAASKTGRVVTVEEHSIIGGLGGAVAEVLVENCPLPLKRVGCRDTYAESGANEDLNEKYGLTPRHVIQAVHGILKFGK